MVHILSSNPNSPVPGWCFMKRERMGEELGLSKQAVLNIIERMIAAGFIYRNPANKTIRTTSKWFSVYASKESLPDGPEPGKESLPFGKESLPEPGKESLPNNNSSNNDTNNTGQAPPPDPVREKKINFCKKLLDWEKRQPGKYPKQMLKDFAEYWLEPSKVLKQIRFDGEKYFDFSKRVHTWFKKTKDEELSKMWELEKESPDLRAQLLTLVKN